jgi:hypothetical protein
MIGDDVSVPAVAAVPPEVPPEMGDQGASDAASENLLNRLLYRGVLPRYAFPTDIAGFYVFDVNKSSSFQLAYRYSPSQSLAVALSQYAPGKEVWIDNKRFFSGAIFSPMRAERFQAWRAKRLYYECKNCHFACTRPLSEGRRGEVSDCPACGKTAAFGEARFWFRPPGFAHPASAPENVTPDELPAKSNATRAKLDAPTPGSGQGSWRNVGERVRAHFLREQLLITNTGPKQDGYTYCTVCGRIEPTSPATGDLVREHSKPYPDLREPMCAGGRAANGVCLGTDFITDILLVSMRVDSPVRLTPGVLATEIVLRTISEALAQATAVVLALEDGEVEANFRAALTQQGLSGLEAEIYLYDTLPGGAGFCRRAGDRLQEVLACAVDLLESCDCDSSCYKCLRSFRNKFEHDRLDRRLAGDLLRYLLHDAPLVLDAGRERRARLILAEDLARQVEQLEVNHDVDFEVAGMGKVTLPLFIRHAPDHEAAVCISHPLTPHTAGTDALEQLKEFAALPVITQSELAIRRNLPRATQHVLDSLGIR